jgi:Trk-type K+ transport system membrane component
MIGDFAALILVATLLLLPWSHLPGRVGVLDALSTSTSVVCVTGLVVVDTAADYTLLGQFIILILMQTGGLAIMTFAALTFQVRWDETSWHRFAANEARLLFGDLAYNLLHLMRQFYLKG